MVALLRIAGVHTRNREYHHTWIFIDTLYYTPEKKSSSGNVTLGCSLLEVIALKS